MSKKAKLDAARRAKNDEFYTQYSDIEKELIHYKDYFEGKIVYCNCDNPEWSNFYFFLRDHFESFGLKKLITTHYNPNGASYKLELTGIGTIKTPLEGNGAFGSEECVEILKGVDVVVSNPPFSLWRDYFDLLTSHNKDFLIIGSFGAVIYKNVFPHVIENKLWIGNKVTEFICGDGIKSVYAIWFTNIQHPKVRPPIELTRTYCPDDYPKYDNYDAIEVSKVKDIPCDYDGLMGVPINFLEKWNREQFELIDILRPWLNGKEKYRRFVIKRKTP